MKQLQDILYKTNLLEVIGTTQVGVSSLAFDSRMVEKNSLFVAVKGTQSDGHQFIGKAIDLGAIVIVCEVMPEDVKEGVTYVRVGDSAQSLGVMASNFYDNPSQQLHLIGVTGTNGKTTIASLLFQLFQSLGYQVGLLSTIENRIQDTIIASTHTTPDAIQLNALLQRMVESGCSYCFMEVSSHAIEQHRIAGLQFKGGIFTNITHDHLDYHITFDNYIAAKKKFFDALPSTAFALSNMDDKNGKVMLQNTKAKKSFYSVHSLTDFSCRIMENRFEGLHMEVNGVEVWCHLVGKFNAYNLLAIYGVALLMNQDKQDVLVKLSQLSPAQGRFDFFKTANHIVTIIDYAHTPDALDNVLDTINAIRTYNETLITVLGAGGDRDKTKRPEMGHIATSKSDRVIFTSDNPRSEEPQQIIEEMKQGVLPTHLKKVIAIVDRKEAIRTACLMAKPGDVVLIAGKGHEDYQDIKGVKYPFDDKKIAKEIFNELIP